MSKKRRKYTEIKLDDEILEEILKNTETERRSFFLKKKRRVGRLFFWEKYRTEECRKVERGIVEKRKHFVSDDDDDFYDDDDLLIDCTARFIPTYMFKKMLKDINPTTPRFCDLLFNYIEQNGQKDSEVYKEARISKQVFSNIRKGKIPTYSNVVKLALAIHCTIKQFESLINSAGYSIQGSNPYDLVIRFCFVNRWYLSYEDFYDVFEAVRKKYPNEQNRFQDWYKEE